MAAIRITARGALPAAGLLLALALLPYLLADTLSPQEAEKLVRDYYERQAMQSFVARYQDGGAGRSHEAAQRMADDIQRMKRIGFRSVRVRRGLIVPPLARRTEFLIEVRREDAAKPQYFRTSRGTAYETSAFWWHVPL